jgi:hypothetical protein
MTLLRILCLHGYRQNGNMFREKTGSFRKLMKKHVAEFVFIDAPHLIPTQDNINEQDGNSATPNRSSERGINLFEDMIFATRYNSICGVLVNESTLKFERITKRHEY